MTDIDTLRAAYEQAEANAQQIMADKDQALQQVQDQYGDPLAQANQDAALAQKALCDAEAAQALADRDDLDEAGKQQLADNLGLTLPE